MKMKDIEDLEAQLEQLRVAYEKYFLGIERREPAEDHRRVARSIRMAGEMHIPQAAVRFRAQSLKARLITYEQYWNRTLREIEEGTYRRHQFRVQQREQMAREFEAAQGSKKPGATAHVDLAGGAGGYDSVVSEYRRIQSQGGQAAVDPAKLAAALQKQEAQLREKFGAKRVEFRVVVEDGKPKVKAKPIK